MVRTRRTVAMAIATALLVPAAGTLSAETRVQTEIESLVATVWTGKELGLAGVSRGGVDFRSAGDRNVQARLQLRLTLTDIAHGEDPDQGSAVAADSGASAGAPAILEVPRASIRFRFPLSETYTMRVTAGRDRLSWGLGSLFNAGDLLFGADGRTAADLSRSAEVRDETAWLLSLYFPIGARGYLETVMLPPLPEMTFASAAETGADTGAVTGTAVDSGTGDIADTEAHQGAASPVKPMRTTRAGLRIHGAFGPMSLEPSWLYDGAAGVHRLSLSAQGSVGADVYGAASLHIPDSGPDDGIDDAGKVLESYSLLSAGAVYMLSPGYDHTVSVRLEALIRPGAAWSDRGERSAVYALQFYPELIWSAGRSVQVIGRGIVSPIDLSTEITGGVNWNLFQGFYLLAFVSGQGGGTSAVYGWDRPGSFAASTGFRYLF